MNQSGSVFAVHTYFLVRSKAARRLKWKRLLRERERRDFLKKQVLECLLFIRFPTGDALRKVATSFKQDYGFPQCTGAIDGTHIPIVSPNECLADYYNRKGWHSTILQGTVDNNSCFVDVYIGWPGRVHDAHVFANFSLYQKGQNKTLLPDWKEKLNNRCSTCNAW